LAPCDELTMKRGAAAAAPDGFAAAAGFGGAAVLAVTNATTPPTSNSTTPARINSRAGLQRALASNFGGGSAGTRQAFGLAAL